MTPYQRATLEESTHGMVRTIRPDGQAEYTSGTTRIIVGGPDERMIDFVERMGS